MRNSPVLLTSTLVRRTSLLAAGALATVALAACGESDTTPVADDPATDPTTSAPATTTPATPTESPSETATPSSTPTSAGSTSASPVTADTLITLAKPGQGAVVSGSFDVRGTANSPEANVPWRLLDGSGRKVADGYFTAEGWMDKLYPYSGKVDVSKLAPGTYTFEVAVDDPSGGEGKKPQKVDVTITVQ